MEWKGVCLFRHRVSVLVHDDGGGKGRGRSDIVHRLGVIFLCFGRE